MARTFANNAESTLASGVAVGATSLTVAAGHGARFPSTGVFSIRLQDASDATIYELVTCTARSTDTLTITATTLAWDAGDKVFHVVAKADLDAFAQGNLANYQALSEKGVANGYPALGSDAKVAAAQGRVRDLLDYKFVRKTADETVTSSTTLQNDDHLTLAFGANEIWTFEGMIRYGTSTTVDISIAFTLPAGATILWGAAAPGIGAASVTDHDAYFGAGTLSGGNLDFGAIGGTAIMHIRGIVLMGGTAGNLQMQWAQRVSSTTAMTVYANSFLDAKRVA
jgi:hypothetical protein